MKKGDIVRLKSGVLLVEAEVGYRSTKEMRRMATFTVKENHGMQKYGCSDDVDVLVSFEEAPEDKYYPYRFIANEFEVVLPAGEPDVAELMREVEARQESGTFMITL